MSQLFMRRPNLDALPEIPSLPPGYALRAYRESDLEPLAALMRAAFDDPQWTSERVQAALIDAPDVRQTFVVEHAGAPVASASARLPEAYPGSGYVHWVATDPEHRGRSLGYSVSLAVLHEFKRLGCKDAILETDDHRLAAIKTYQRLGFVPENRHESHAARWAVVLANLMAAANM